MIPKEKAKKLFDKMAFEVCKTDAKQCALIAVDEIIENNSKITGLLTQDTMRNDWFWQEVKTEIKKL